MEHLSTVTRSGIRSRSGNGGSGAGVTQEPEEDTGGSNPPPGSPSSHSGSGSGSGSGSSPLNAAEQVMERMAAEAGSNTRTRLSQPDPLINPDIYQADYFRGLQHIPLNELLKEKLKIRNIQFKCLDLQLLKIIVSKPDEKQGRYNYRGRNERQTAGFQYSRMFLCRVLDMNSSFESQSCVYLVETPHENRDLWSLNIVCRDSGVICPGSFFRICDIQQAKYNIGNVPCLVSNGQAIPLKPPATFPTVSIRSNLQPNFSYAFILNNCSLEFYRVTPVDTRCGGYFCDKQRAYGNTNPKCGCYGTPKGRSNMVLCIQLDVFNEDKHLVLEEEHYSSQQFAKFYSIGEFKPDTNAREFRMSNEFKALEGAMNQCFKHVNDNGGWTVFGWYRKGQIDDKILTGMEDDLQKMEGSVTHHIVSIVPTNAAFRTPDTVHFQALLDKKYDLGATPVQDTET